jgi:hypothetical protein
VGAIPPDYFNTYHIRRVIANENRHRESCFLWQLIRAKFSLSGGGNLRRLKSVVHIE